MFQDIGIGLTDDLATEKLLSTPKGNRTPVLALRGLRPRPLDDRAEIEARMNAKLRLDVVDGNVADRMNFPNRSFHTITQLAKLIRMGRSSRGPAQSRRVPSHEDPGFWERQRQSAMNERWMQFLPIPS